MEVLQQACACKVCVPHLDFELSHHGGYFFFQGFRDLSGFRELSSRVGISVRCMYPFHEAASAGEVGVYFERQESALSTTLCVLIKLCPRRCRPCL